MITVSVSTAVVLQIPVSDVNFTKCFPSVILENGAEVSLLPYGIQKEFKTKCLIGNGVVIDPKVLLSDFKALEANGIDFKQKTVISSR